MSSLSLNLRVGVEAEKHATEAVVDEGVGGLGDDVGEGAGLDAGLPEAGDAVVVLFEDLAANGVPVGGLGGLLPFAASTSEVGDGEVGEHGEADLLAEVLAGPVEALIAATDEVVALDQSIGTDACGDAAEEGTAAEGHAAHFEVGDEAAHGSASDTADDAPDGFGDLLGEVEFVLGELAETACGLALQAVEFDELVGGADKAVGESGGELFAGVLVFFVQLLAGDADALPELLSPDFDAIDDGGGEELGEDATGLVEDFEITMMPGAFEMLEGFGLWFLNEGTQGLHEAVFLDPAAGEGIKADDFADDGPLFQMIAPGLDLGFFDGGFLSRPGLVEKDEDGLADPAEDLHLGGDVGGDFGGLGGVDEVEDDIGFFADVF